MSALGEPALVLGYHRVAELASDVHGLCVAPSRFADHVDHLRRHEHTVPLAEARRRARRRRVAVTFDDGYADNATTARGILEAGDVPATCFVSSDLVGTTDERWWDELELVVLGGEPRSRHAEVEVGGRRVLLDLADRAARERAHASLYARLRPLDLASIATVIDQLRASIDAPPAGRASHRFMDVDDLRSLAGSPVISIGGHGRTHVALADLDEDQQWDEVVGCRAALQAWTGQPVDAFAYPYGGRTSFGSETTQLVAAAGFALACTTTPGLVRRRTHPMRLPRMIVGDWSAEELAGRIDAWFRHAA